MRFGTPANLWLLWLAPALALLLWLAYRLRARARIRFADESLLSRLLTGYSPKRRATKAILLVLAVFLLAFALARPQFGEKMVFMKRRGVDIVIVLDTSHSMLARDMRPDRLSKAKQEIYGMLERMAGDRVGLVCFAGEAIVQCPLTLDYSAAQVLVNAVDIYSVSRPGTAITEAIRAGVGMFDASEKKFKVMLLITDGEDHEGEVETAAEEAKKAGVIIHAIGIGSPSGEPIPELDAQGQVTGFKKDQADRVILSKLDEYTLQKAALATGGKYYRASAGELELDKIYDEISQMEKKELEGKLFTQYEDRFNWFLVPAIILFALEAALSERRKTKPPLDQA
ncbi:VWA domain-containing protein [Candidatus Zixiibacteriota bacterium]